MSGGSGSGGDDGSELRVEGEGVLEFSQRSENESQRNRNKENSAKPVYDHELHQFQQQK